MIGGGASGTLAAIALLRHTRADVGVVEPRPRLGRGVAYSTPDRLHRLNVPAGSMSALPDDPDHLVRWLETRDGEDAGPFSFPRRSEYGVYLAETLRAAAGERADDRLTHLRTSVRGIEQRADGWALRLQSGGELVADAVVLAVGASASPEPHWAAGVLDHPGYVPDPWDGDALTRLPDGPVLCVGTGLSAVDVALSATEWSSYSSVLAISRHGLHPLAHRAGGAPEWPPRLAAGRPPTALGLLRAVRAEVALGQARDMDWRDVMNGLRPAVPGLWAALPERERERVADRLGRFWDVHRHRLSPDVAAQVGSLERAGRLRFEAGRVDRVEPAGHALGVALRRPDGRTSRHLVAAVVNCTGRSGDVTASPLLARLHAAGLCRRGSAGLGVACDAHGAVLDAMGRPTGMLALGPLRRGDLWESTAIPEIRGQAFAIAEAIAGQSAGSLTLAG